MSIQTWKDEFMPVDAADVAKRDALAHSCRKWLGLTPENMKRHRVGFNGSWRVLYPINMRACDAVNVINVDDSTCALCHHFCIDHECDTCPLFKARGGYPCDKPNVGEALAPYDAAIEGDVQPMLSSLVKLLDAQTARRKTQAARRG